MVIFAKKIVSMPISVVMNTYNASEHLDRVLREVKDFGEIVICDMESTDNTVEIARSHGARVVTFPKGNHTCAEPARNFAIRSASNEWVLLIDADEIIPEALRKHLYEFIKNPGDVRGLFIARKNFMLNRFSASTYPDYQMRFFLRDHIDWPPYVHAHPVVDGRVANLPAERQDLAMLHIPPSINGMLDRMNRYTDAEVIKRSGKKVSYLSFITKPFARFFKSYILKGGIRNGVSGLLTAVNDSTYCFYRQAKLYEHLHRDDIFNAK
jgi:glycosyltransferase involved in cell wall biosynthesis